MGGLTEQQVKFLDELGKGPKGVRELLDDHGLTWRDFKRWHDDPVFAEAMDEVVGWLALVRELDVRIGATEALRKQRQFVCHEDFYLSERQRHVGDGLWHKARQLDTRFPRQWRQVGTAREICPLHPDHLKDAREIVRRMEELRRASLEARAREKAAKARPALPAPVVEAVETVEAQEPGTA
jgi:hypothetical protein